MANYYVIAMSPNNDSNYSYMPLPVKEAYSCSCGWHVVPTDTPTETALVQAREAFATKQAKPMYPDGVAELNSLQSQYLIRYEGNWYEDLTDEQVKQFRAHPLVVSIEETDWDPFDYE